MKFLIFRINKNHINVISVHVRNKVVVRMVVPAHWLSTSYVSSGSVAQTVSTRKTSSWRERTGKMSRIINKKRLGYIKVDVRTII